VELKLDWAGPRGVSVTQSLYKGPSISVFIALNFTRISRRRKRVSPKCSNILRTQQQQQQQQTLHILNIGISRSQCTLHIPNMARSRCHDTPTGSTPTSPTPVVNSHIEKVLLKLFPFIDGIDILALLDEITNNMRHSRPFILKLQLRVCPPSVTFSSLHQ
jgi:hypothetical protein